VADSPPVNAVGGSACPRGASEADRAITAMYDTEYRPLVRMSAVLLGDVGAAEEVVQDSFIAVHAAWRRLRDVEKAVPYLRRSVLNRSRSLLRHRITRPECSAVIAALRRLPARQQEALMLRFYLELSEEEVAAAMKISPGAVQGHTARGKAALSTVLEPER